MRYTTCKGVRYCCSERGEEVRRCWKCETERRMEERCSRPCSRAVAAGPSAIQKTARAIRWLHTAYPKVRFTGPEPRNYAAARSDRLLPHQNDIIAGFMNANMNRMDPRASLPGVFAHAMGLSWRLQ